LILIPFGRSRLSVSLEKNHKKRRNLSTSGVEVSFVSRGNIKVQQKKISRWP
jgi:hypothetical protein